MIKNSHKGTWPESKILVSKTKHFLNNVKMTKPPLFTSCHDYEELMRANLWKKRVNINIDLELLSSFSLSFTSQYFHELFIRITYLPKDKVNIVFNPANYSQVT